MSDPKKHDTSNQYLLTALQEGWSALPLKTVFSLVLAGLRVRLSRSLVTMLAIVLAIAFLTYMGAINSLTFNLASNARELEESVHVDQSELRATVDQLLASQPPVLWPDDQLLQAAGLLGLDRTAHLVELVEELTAEIEETVVPERTLAEEQLARLEARPDVSESELNAARNWARETRQREEEAGQRKQRLEQRIELADLLEGTPGDLTAEQRNLLSQTLLERQSELLRTFRTPERFRAEDLRMAGHLASQLQRHEEHAAAAAILQAALMEERENRIASELTRLLRRAGINMDETLAGSHADTWLIVMALLLCTVGIANAMLMSVTERFREIGTMKCLGAQDSLVVKLFLLESGMLGLVGALFGILLGLLVALAGGLLQFRFYALSYFPYTEIWIVFGWSFLAGIILAVIGTLYPAVLAARMNPVDALRVEE